MSGLGRILIITGVAIIILGVALLFLDKIPFIGRLPGDIIIKRKNFTLYFPLGTSILISLLLTAILFIINLFRR
jgi:hypothetical protein